jgi:hypothetical protein
MRRAPAGNGLPNVRHRRSACASWAEGSGSPGHARCFLRPRCSGLRSARDTLRRVRSDGRADAEIDHKQPRRLFAEWFPDPAGHRYSPSSPCARRRNAHTELLCHERIDQVVKGLRWPDRAYSRIRMQPPPRALPAPGRLQHRFRDAVMMQVETALPIENQSTSPAVRVAGPRRASLGL